MQRKTIRGYFMIEMLGIIMVGLFVSSVSIDVYYYFANHSVLQAASDAGALAGAKELASSNITSISQRQVNAAFESASLVSEYATPDNPISLDTTQDITFGFIDPTTHRYDPATFSTLSNDPNYSSMGGVNAVQVTIRKTQESPNGPVSTIMARLLGADTMDMSATSTAMIENNLKEVKHGLRPFYACFNQYLQANSDGNPRNNIVRFFGENFLLDGSPVAGCPTLDSGNVGFADLRDSASGAPGNSTLANWILNGFNSNDTENSVYIDHYYYSTQPGNSISSHNISSALNSLVTNQTPIMVPLIDGFSGSGSNAQGHVAGFAGFIITDYDINVNSGDRYIEGYFTHSICHENCVGNGNSNTSTSISKIKLIG